MTEHIRINTHGGPMPEQHGDWIDLMAAEDVTLKKGDRKIISLGVSMELPEECFAMVVPRSSTFKYYHIMMANSVGIIDNAYCGDDDVWGFPAVAMEDTFIKKGTRIAQFTIMRSADVSFEKVDSLGNENRGGFGSTGK